MKSYEQNNNMIDGEVVSATSGPGNPDAIKVEVNRPGFAPVQSGDPEGTMLTEQDMHADILPDSALGTEVTPIEENPSAQKRGQATVWIIVVAALILIAIGAFMYFSTNRTETVDTPDNPTGGQADDGVTAGQVTQIKLFYYALDDKGARGKLIGCGDSIVPLTKDIPATKAPLTAALNALFADKRTDVEEGLKNALYQSTLTLESAAVVGGKATIRIRGTTQLGGVCDDPRFMAQIEETVFQFPTVTSAEIFINGELMKSYFSQKS